MLIFFNVQDEDDEMLKEFILRKSKSNLDLSSNQIRALKRAIKTFIVLYYFKSVKKNHD